MGTVISKFGWMFQANHPDLGPHTVLLTHIQDYEGAVAFIERGGRTWTEARALTEPLQECDQDLE